MRRVRGHRRNNPHLVQIHLPPRAAATIGKGEFTLRSQPDGSIIPELRATGTWEPYLMEVIVERLPPGGTFIDVGAHIGIHSVLAALRVGPLGRVLAIEASPVTFPVLAQNLASSGCPGATAVHRGAWDLPATLTFCHVPKNPAHSHFSITGNPRGQRFPVACEPLDNLVEQAGLNRLDLIKVDVEGSEIRVLEGARKTLRTYRPPIIIEVNPGTLRDNLGTSSQDLYQCLRDLGYNLTALSRDFRRVPVSDFHMLVQFGGIDVLCEPATRRGPRDSLPDGHPHQPAPEQQDPFEIVQVSLPPRAAAALGQSTLAIRGPSADLSVVGVIRRTGCYEPHVMEAIIDKLPVGGTLIDVGANIGVHSVLAALRSGSEGRILALEASPVTYPTLTANLAAAGCPGAAAEQIAVWDAPATVAFTHIPHIIGGSHVHPAARENGRVFTVPCDSLDNLVERTGLERVDLIKIDVEGSETRVLLGARETLSRYHPPLIVEFNPLTLREYGSSSVADLYQCLCDLGYRMQILSEDGRIMPVTDFSEMEQISLQWTLRLDMLCEHLG